MSLILGRFSNSLDDAMIVYFWIKERDLKEWRPLRGILRKFKTTMKRGNAVAPRFRGISLLRRAIESNQFILLSVEALSENMLERREDNSFKSLINQIRQSTLENSHLIPSFAQLNFMKDEWKIGNGTHNVSLQNTKKTEGDAMQISDEVVLQHYVNDINSHSWAILDRGKTHNDSAIMRCRNCGLIWKSRFIEPSRAISVE